MRSDKELKTIDLLMAGGFSGFAAWLPSYPQDVIKSCYQNDARYIDHISIQLNTEILMLL